MPPSHPSPLPPVVDLRLSTCPAVIVQTQPGSTCISIAASGAYWSTANRQAGHVVDRPSSRFIAWACKERNLRAAFGSMQKEGVCPAYMWDWEDPVATGKSIAEQIMEAPPPSIVELASQHPATQIQKSRADVDALRQCLSAAYAPAFDGGTHEQVIVGYDDTTRLFTVMNSHGTLWGDQGCWYVPYDALGTSWQIADIWSVRGVQ